MKSPIRNLLTLCPFLIILTIFQVQAQNSKLKVSWSKPEPLKDLKDELRKEKKERKKALKELSDSLAAHQADTILLKEGNYLLVSFDQSKKEKKLILEKYGKDRKLIKTKKITIDRIGKKLLGTVIFPYFLRMGQNNYIIVKEINIAGYTIFRKVVDPEAMTMTSIKDPLTISPFDAKFSVNEDNQVFYVSGIKLDKSTKPKKYFYEVKKFDADFKLLDSRKLYEDADANWVTHENYYLDDNGNIEAHYRAPVGVAKNFKANLTEPVVGFLDFERNKAVNIRVKVDDAKIIYPSHFEGLSDTSIIVYGYIAKASTRLRVFNQKYYSRGILQTCKYQQRQDNFGSLFIFSR